jgi:hypothetical protein
MNESLLPSDSDGGRESNSNALSQSQASLQRSVSLLERIRAQREREAMPSSEPTASTSTAPDVNVPNYTPASSYAVGTSPPARSIMGASSLNFSGLIRGFGRSTSGPPDDLEAARRLLDNEQDTPSYSMSAYFRMFVVDMYNYYRTLPIPAQAFGIVFMLWIIYHLI